MGWIRGKFKLNCHPKWYNWIQSVNESKHTANGIWRTHDLYSYANNICEQLWIMETCGSMKSNKALSRPSLPTIDYLIHTSWQNPNPPHKFPKLLQLLINQWPSPFIFFISPTKINKHGFLYTFTPYLISGTYFFFSPKFSNFPNSYSNFYCLFVCWFSYAQARVECLRHHWLWRNQEKWMWWWVKEE